MKLLVILLCLVLNDSLTDAPRYESEQDFPVVEKQTHAPGIVELANGDGSWQELLYTLILLEDCGQQATFGGKLTISYAHAWPSCGELLEPAAEN